MDTCMNVIKTEEKIKNASPRVDTSHILTCSTKNERKIIKVFLLTYLYNLLREIVLQNNFLKEWPKMDNKIIRYLIQSIIETEQYTLEGISFYTHIPYDVLYDAASGI